MAYKNFEDILKARGLKHADVARGTGLANSVFSDWKTGKSAPKIDKIYKIADYLGVDPDVLADRNPSSTAVSWGKPKQQKSTAVGWGNTKKKTTTSSKDWKDDLYNAFDKAAEDCKKDTEVKNLINLSNLAQHDEQAQEILDQYKGTKKKMEEYNIKKAIEALTSMNKAQQQILYLVRNLNEDQQQMVLDFIKTYKSNKIKFGR